MTYGELIQAAFDKILTEMDDSFILGQGVWSPWYVGGTLNDLEKKFGVDRVIDTPVSEAACTGVAVGAALLGKRPIIIHPRMDFMMYAMDPIINHAAKWNYMFGGDTRCPITIRAIINRGGEQGAQHSQNLQAFFGHIPGLRVVCPATPKDAGDLLFASVLSDDPVIFIDDRWLYDLADESIKEFSYSGIALSEARPQIIVEGHDVTLVGIGWSTQLCLEASRSLANDGLTCEIIDLRVLNPLNIDAVLRSVQKTGRLVVVDGAWGPFGMSSEVIGRVAEKVDWEAVKSNPRRVVLPFAPAPTASSSEADYYPTSDLICEEVKLALRS